MTALPEDSWLRTLRPQPDRLTSAEYEALPEEVCRAIEVVDGYIFYCESPSREHQRAARRLANLIEVAARSAMNLGGDCMSVDLDVDLRLQDVPLGIRRADVVLYRCLDRGEVLRPPEVLLVVEIVSPGSVTTGTMDKHAEYAAGEIPFYWIVRLDATGIASIERYHLDRGSGLYKHVGTFMKDELAASPHVTNPIPIDIDWDELAF